MACDVCISMAVTGPESFGQHHNKRCPKYKTERFPYLFYYEESENCWIPVPDEINNIIDVSQALDEDEKIEIQFRRSDFTDAEFDSLPVN